MDILIIVFTAIFTENFILSKFLGICPFLGVSKKIETAIGMSMAVIFVMTMASAITWVVSYYILKPFAIEYLQTIAFILIIASLVQLTEMAIQKSSPELYRALGIYLPLITTNCAILGVSVLNQNKGYGFLESVVNGISSAVGFGLALILFAGIRERLDSANLPLSFKGVSIVLITAGILSLAFMGFTGLVPIR